MIDELKQKAMHDFKTNCLNGIEAYKTLESFTGNYNDERMIRVIAHAYFSAAHAFANNYVLCDDFFPYVVLRTYDQKGQRPFPHWILKAIEDNNGIIPSTISWIDGVAVARK